MLVESKPNQPAAFPGPAAGRETSGLRSFMRHWTTGTCVVTTAARGMRAGLVVNSFTSVSLEPALVSWCVDKASTSFGIWMDTENFSVHLLDPTTAHHIPRFVQRGVDKFAGLELLAGTTGSPALPDVQLRLDCRLWGRYEGGDHIIMVGAVDHIAQPDPTMPFEDPPSS